MKKKISFILIIFMLMQSLCLFNFEKAEAGTPPTKVITHTIVESRWFSYKSVGRNTYAYDDGLWYGTLRKVNSTYEEKRDERRIYSDILSDSKKYLQSDSPDYRQYWLVDRGYSNPTITDQYWRGSVEEGDFLASNGSRYKYRRACTVWFRYDSFKATHYYEGTVTARTIPPEISVSKPTVNAQYHNQERIYLEGFIKDEDKADKLTIKYSIEGTSHTDKNIILTSPTLITATGNNELYKGYIQLDQSIDPGNYKLKVWAKDDKGAESNTVEIPIKIYNVLENLKDDIEKYITIDKNNDLRIIIPNTKDKTTQSDINDSLINQIKNLISERDGKLYYIGQDGVTKTYINDNLTNDYGKYTDNNINNIVSFIINENNKLLDNKTNIFLIDDFINYSMQFEDIEKDYLDITIQDKLKPNDQLSENAKKPKVLYAKYVHNPNIFDNPVPKHAKGNDQWHKISSINDSFMISKTNSSMRGKWTLTLKGSDNTKKPSWDKYSEDKSYTFIVHVKPTAVIEYWKEETDTQLFLTSENSYDTDFEISKPNRGITLYTWKYQLEDGNWHTFISSPTAKRITLSKTISGKKVDNYSLTVTDCYNAADTVSASVNHPVLMEPEPTLLTPDSIYVGPHGSDELKVSNDSEPKSRILNYQYIFNFKSVSNNLNIAKNTIVNASSYTFAKNTLRYGTSKNPFTRNATLKLTIDTGVVKQATKPIVFTPVIIDKLDTETIAKDIVTFKADIVNSNPSTHKVITTVNGVDYDMNFIRGQRWEKDINIVGADKIYVRVEKRTDNKIIYDRGEIIANRPPEVEILVDKNKVYEGDTTKVSILANDPDLDKLNLVVKHRVDGGSWDIIWSKNNIPSGEKQEFNITNVKTGSNELMVTATDPLGATATDTITYLVLPVIVHGVLIPNPALAGDELIFTIDTEGYVEKIEILFPEEIVVKDDIPGKFNRTGKYKYPLTFNVDGSKNIKSGVFKYISSVAIDKTMTFDSKRLRQPYTIIVKAYKGEVIKEIELKLDIRRSVLDLVKPGIKYKGSTPE